MNKSNPGAATAYSWLLVNQPRTLCFEMGQGSLNVGHGKCDVVHALAAGLDEPPDGRIRA
jgi:hypothetical protein